MMKLIRYSVLAAAVSSLSEISAGSKSAKTLRKQPSISLDKVLDGKNVTAIVVDAKALSNNTIQLVFEANISRAAGSIQPSLDPPESNTTSEATSVSLSTSTNLTTSKPTVVAPALNKTRISIIYGAEDPESVALIGSLEFRKFFTRADILNHTELEMVPYGNASEINVNTLSEGFLYWHPELRRGNITHVYRCPNGESECEASLIHGCAIQVSGNDPRVYVPFIGCMANSTRGTAPEDSSFSCSNSTSFMESLKECALGPIGIENQHYLAAKASLAKTIPSIYINREYHPFNVTSNIQKFDNFICDALFAQAQMDRDTCEGKDDKQFVAPFESLLTSPSSNTNKNPSF
jgi:hypothetical protein